MHAVSVGNQLQLIVHAPLLAVQCIRCGSPEACFVNAVDPGKLQSSCRRPLTGDLAAATQGMPHYCPSIATTALTKGRLQSLRKDSQIQALALAVLCRSSQATML
jgi:hypothetical protein